MRKCDFCGKSLGRVHGQQRYHTGECRRKAYVQKTKQWQAAHPYKERIIAKHKTLTNVAPLEEYAVHLPGGWSSAQWQSAGLGPMG